MRSPQYHISLPPALAGQVEDMAELTGQAISSVVRRCVQHALASPEFKVLLASDAALVDSRTPEQIANWERYQQQAFDPATLLT